ncbi:MAG: histidine--tRNA ligase [Patescibacteria group bacterium]
MKTELLQTARGVRDFGPEEKIAKDYLIGVLRQTFEAFGFNPIETPILERYELFASKFGLGNDSEAMRETFRLKDQGDRDLVLRTEFTMSFARFIGSNPQLRKPFKRYQMGSVFRDGPIKAGRYREFWQCDVDAVGIGETMIDGEILQLVNAVFQKFALPVVIKINNRKFLNKLLSFCGFDETKQTSVIISIDKLDKIGNDGVKKELLEKGFDEDCIDKILQMLSARGTNEELINKFRNILGENDGLSEIESALNFSLDQANIVFEPSLARGLAYYTGNVFEVFLQDSSKISSSVAGGGRYDRMIGGLIGSQEEIPAIGISFGLETIYDALVLQNKLKLKKSVVEYLVVPMQESLTKKAMQVAEDIRKLGYNVDTNYFFKIKKSLEYANSYNIEKVVILGEEESNNEEITVKNMVDGQQKTGKLAKLIDQK